MNFEEFHAKAGYFVSLTELNNVSQLQKQIVEYISTMKKKDGSEYKASSVKQAVDALNRHFLHHSSIPHINLHDKYMFPDLHNRGINGGEAQIISIPGDNNGPCSDIHWYRTAHVGKNRLNKFMQNIGRETQIDIPIELLSNHSEHKTATQIL
ncbi:hypothetical protein C1645_830197 [Glomus cerebriforme]|uniref:Uncharacterized protein n=1 Tax=Glomus cerebriforme TaxID=658196 RepID=A0A397SI32_9GLOM|nr:hypothetical protein C1645_830197 [Glomus cerebriforme]